RPKLPEKVSSYAWKPDERAADQNRRSVYVFAKRNMRYPLFDAFDLPDMHNSCGRRVTATPAPPALLPPTGDFPQAPARQWARDRRRRTPTDDAGLVGRGYRLAWGRDATAAEVQLGVQFLQAQAASFRSAAGPSALPAGGPKDVEPARAAAVVDFCHAL